MRRDEMLARRLATEVEIELDGLSRLGPELEQAPRGDDSYSLRARGSILHDFYTGVEKVFVRIAEELNGGVPKGEQWHRQLILDMAVELSGIRPAVIDRDLATALGDYLRFRHVFRNIYGSVLESERMAPLESHLSSVLGELLSQIRGFLTWMVGEF